MDEKILDSAFRELLKEIIPFNKKHEQEQNSGFNILRAVRSSNDEVRLHSRFIASLLDPMAPHELGKKPLELFLKHVKLNKNIDYKDVLKVKPNYKDKSEFHEMDILVRAKNHAVLIENKIFAADSNFPADNKVDSEGEKLRKGQLERYYAILVKEGYSQENIKVLYLTVDGHRPSEDSTGESRKNDDELKFKDLPDKVKCITYGKEILEWLDELVKYEGINETIKGYINQYIMIVKEMTNNLSPKERIKVVDKIGELRPEERKALATVFANEKDLCWHIAAMFFENLYKSVSSMTIENEKGEKCEVDNIYSKMPDILNDTVGPKGRKSSKEIIIKKGDKSSTLKLNQGVIEVDSFKIDFNDLSKEETINLANEDFRKNKVAELLEMMVWQK